MISLGPVLRTLPASPDPARSVDSWLHWQTPFAALPPPETARANHPHPCHHHYHRRRKYPRAYPRPYPRPASDTLHPTPPSRSSSSASSDLASPQTHSPPLQLSPCITPRHGTPPSTVAGLLFSSLGFPQFGSTRDPPRPPFDSLGSSSEYGPGRAHRFEPPVLQSYLASLPPGDVPAAEKPPSSPRKRGSASVITVDSDVRVKRLKQSTLQPSHHIGYPEPEDDISTHDEDDDENDDSRLVPDADTDEEDGDEYVQMLPPPLPQQALEVLAALSPAALEVQCVPWTIETQHILHHFPEVFPEHTRLTPTTKRDLRQAQRLVRFATFVHTACCRLSAAGSDEAAWYPAVRMLLSVQPPASPGSMICRRAPAGNSALAITSSSDRFLAIDATTKETSRKVLDNYPNVKVDVLLIFDPEHARHRHLRKLAASHSLRLNPFNQPGFEQTISLAGVEVKPTTGGSTGELGAEYQLGTLAVKTMETMSLLSEDGNDVALSISVVGHSWMMHLTYWVRARKSLVTHGPVPIGSTATVLGTLRIIRFVAAVKKWGVDIVWPAWERRVAAAVDALSVRSRD